MGLFNRKKKVIPYLMDFAYDVTSLHESISKLSPDLYEARQDNGSQVFVKYTQKLLNLEVLNLAAERDKSQESYNYHRGRLDALKDLINRREKYLADESNARTKDTSKKTEHKSKRSYIQRPSTAGLS